MTDSGRRATSWPTGTASPRTPPRSWRWGDTTTVLWQEAFGRLDQPRRALRPPVSTPSIDLASLTKVLSTTILAMGAVNDGGLRLDRPPRRPSRRIGAAPTERAVTVRGSARARLRPDPRTSPSIRDHAGRAEFERAICTLPLEYRPRTRVHLQRPRVHACSGSCWTTSLDRADGRRRFRISGAAGAGATSRTGPPPDLRARAAPTEVDPWRGRRLVGEVHDRERLGARQRLPVTRACSGTAGAVGRIARDVLRALAG